MQPTPPPRFLTLAGLVVIGIVLGFVGAVVLSLRRTVGTVDIPWGLVLAVLGVSCSIRGAAWLVGSRRGAGAVLVGWLVPSLALSAINPGGDVVLADEPRTYVYLFATFALGLLAVSWPLPQGAAELAWGSGHEAHPASDSAPDSAPDSAADPDPGTGPDDPGLQGEPTPADA